ncbi:MAG TPA: phage tail tape measure protein, partial [Candidatus Limnocylindrales bacterium]
MLQAANLYANVTVAGAGQSVAALRGVSGAVDAAQARFSILGLKSQGMAKGLRQIAGGLVQVGEYAVAGLAAVTLASAREASGFQQQMELIHTQAGATQGEVASMTKAVQDMVHAVGTSPDELAKGLYHIESVGVRGAAALDVLKASAIGAKMGLADMESVSNALAAVSKSGSAIGGVKDMVTAMGTLNAIVGVGNMRMQDLVDAFGTGILGTSKAFGVGLRELGSALAVLTDAGVPAQVAATRLTTTFSHMAAPTAAALKVFKTLGISQFQFAADLRSPDGVFKAFEDLRAHLIAVGEWDAKMGRPTPQGTADVTKIFGGSRFGATAMQLLGQLDRVKLKYDQIGVSQSTFGEKVTATMATAGFHWGQFIADLKNDAISFGTGTLPALIRGLDRLDSFVVAHRADAVKLGVEVGDAIDKIGAAFDRIDWSRFQAGFEMVKGVADIAIQALKLVPPEAAVAFGALVGIDKLSGGLFGKGIGNIGGSILGQFLGRGSVTNPM